MLRRLLAAPACSIFPRVRVSVWVMESYPGQKSGDWYQETVEVDTVGRQTRELTGLIDQYVARSDVQTGLCHIFLQHTSASLLLSENADPAVQVDLEHFMQRIIRDGDPAYRHTSEGPDDMSAHLRSVLTGSFLTLPVVEHRLGLGVWQGVYLWEHRYQGRKRRLVLTIQGEGRAL